MKFQYNEYFKVLFSGSICIMIFSLIAIIVDITLLIKGIGCNKHDKKTIEPLIGAIVSVFLFTLGFSPFKHGVHLIREKESDKIISVGEVVSFKKTYGINKYVYNGENSFAYYIVIDDEMYYIMYTGDIVVGDKVEFEYLPKSKVVLSINKK